MDHLGRNKARRWGKREGRREGESGRERGKWKKIKKDERRGGVRREKGRAVSSLPTLLWSPGGPGAQRPPGEYVLICLLFSGIYPTCADLSPGSGPGSSRDWQPRACRPGCHSNTSLLGTSI